MEIFGWIFYKKSTLKKIDEAWDKSEYIRNFCSIMEEANELAEKIPASTAALRPTICANSKDNRIIWQIPRLNRDAVFMRADRETNEELNLDRWVVYVSARQFYFWWRWSAKADPSRLSMQIENKNRPPIFDRIEEDHKYINQNHWKDGIDNPTVLPSVSWSAEKGIDFHDGITRTMWLIRNGAAIFPIETTMEGAVYLHNLVGYSEMKPENLLELWSQYKI